MPQQGTPNENHNICLCGKIAVLTADKQSISGAGYLAKYFSYLSMKTFFKRNASMGLSAISAKGDNLCHSWLIQQKIRWYFSYVPQKSGFYISCRFSPLMTICMKYQVLFPGKNKKKINFFICKNKTKQKKKIPGMWSIEKINEMLSLGTVFREK